ncbi:MAG: tRNA preQ1(34) S-adenosylmethionine ribosyltransferase-isomerase QueA [Geobacter sp.]|nr:tRNA preQ1(34) S-adenosylmethionine ribosyltransferase-isomerase QueA [Geobacter sp.]
MRLKDFDYFLPEKLIAVEPPEKRESARLLAVDRCSGALTNSAIASLPDFLRKGDLLVFNDTKVIPARLYGRKKSGGRVELFLVRRAAGEAEEWSALIRSSKPPRVGTLIELADGVVAAVIDTAGEGAWLVRFTNAGDFAVWLEQNGAVPLPPYIRREPQKADRHRYQTVFAREAGAVAAPTAGLHFTEELLGSIAGVGVATAFLTLHVGLGTFMPVRVDDPRQHKMHREFYSIPPETIAAVRRCRQSGGRVIAVGTTVARTLEYAATKGELEAGSGDADIFIYPGYRFKVVDALVTNFHLPMSTLLMLVSAFAGRELILAAYRHAVEQEYRFFSYGDAMFIY